MKCYPMILVGLLLFSNCSLAVEASHGEVSVSEKGQTMQDKYKALASRLDAVEGSPEFDTVARIGADIDSLPLARKEDPEWRTWRRSKLELWFRALDLIDRTKDPTFNPGDVPQLNVAPPPGASVSAGASPSHIKDPKLRQEYEQAIKRNAEKAKRYLLQWEIPKLDRQWTETIKTYISSQYSTADQDVIEIRTLIDRRISRDARREQIRTFIMQRERPRR